MDIKVSFYKNMIDVKGVGVDLEKILVAIKAGRWADKVTKHREKKIDAKASIPCFSVGGIFSPTRANKNCVEPSGLLSIDLDAVEDFQGVYNVLILNKNIIYSYFKSLGGKGLCLLIKIPPTKDLSKFKSRYRAVYELLESSGISNYCKLDDLSDLSRLRYVSYDPDLYLNLDAEVFLGVVNQEEEQVLTQTRYNVTSENTEYIEEKEQLIATLTKYAESVGNFGVNGSTRHDWILGASRWLCRAGVDESTCYNYLLDNYNNPDRPSTSIWATEVKRAVKSSYNTYSAEQGTFRFKKKFSYEDIKACNNSEEIKEQLLLLIENKNKLVDYLVNNKKETKFVTQEIEFLKITYKWVR